MFSFLANNKRPLAVTIPLTVFVLVLLSGSWIGYSFYSQISKQITNETITELKKDSELVNLLLQVEYRQAYRDLVILSRSIALRGVTDNLMSNDNDLKQQKRLGFEKLAAQLLATTPSYSQVRIIENITPGNEVARVDKKNNEIIIVEPKDYQNKARRDYFKNAVRTKQGQVYISDITLNREYGEVVYPIEPVLRFSAPIYDASNQVVAVVVLNIDFNANIEMLRSINPPDASLVLVNQYGDYLIQDDMNRVFGFDQNSRYKIQDDYPELGRLFSDKVAAERLVDVSTVNGDVVDAYYMQLSFDRINYNNKFALVY
ncbi:MAG: PDC sensor domain-containing protein, partial [Kangiellaceae bacterium]|nr:PDC sensor domain-containing protein [Kangiellaceae bacterium]